MGYALRILRTAGLVATRKVGQVVFYRLAPDFPEPLRCRPQAGISRVDHPMAATI